MPGAPITRDRDIYEAGVVNAHASGTLAPRFLAPHERDQSEVEDPNEYSTWNLDTWRAVRDVDFTLHVRSPIRVGRSGVAEIFDGGVRRRIVARAGESVQIPRVYRNSVQRTDATGRVIGGYCPEGLVRVEAGGEVVAPLHPAIDASRPTPAKGRSPDPGAEGRLSARLAKGGAS
jgi:hypothetical protein